MSDSIEAMRKAQEDRFFKLEQERHIAEYVKKLKLSGRFDSIPAPKARSVSSSALPQVLAHSVRLSTPEQETHVTRQLDRSFLTRHVVKGVCTGDPYLIGSLNFFVASSMMLFMWKGEQYGLGFIPSINRLVPLRAASVADEELRAAGKGYRRVSKTHFAFLQMYIALTGASFIDFCFATQRFSVYSQYHGFAHFHEAVAPLMGVFMSVGLLFMASVLHHTPRIHPFDKLLWWVNFYVLVKLIQILVSIFEYYTVALEGEAKQAEETAANATYAPPPST